jgi:hypothetical protein
LLDERASLTLDWQIRNHARQCLCCRRSLTVYEGIAQWPVRDNPAHQPASLLATREQSWKRRQRRVLRNRLAMASAALMFVSLILVARQPVDSPMVMLSELQRQPANERSVAGVADPALSTAIDIAGWWSGPWTGSLVAASGSDWVSISDIDMISWIPQEPVRAVQSLPATIETIQPIYRYSSDLPLLKPWSSGINYTLGLIQASWRQSSAAQVPADNDLGSHRVIQPGDLCDLAKPLATAGRRGWPETV